MIRWSNEDAVGEPGGFGVVYKTRRRTDDGTENEYFAKKILNRDDEDSINRFKREVRLCSRLNHPRIIEIVASRLEKSPFFYVMPLYNNSMKEIMQDIKGDFEKIRSIFNLIFDGVEYLHSEGVFHRDLKPANILMNRSDDLVISDFGLGIQPESDSTRLTMTSMGMGTEFFSSPEQRLNAKDVDNRTDIYSLGCMIYLCFINEIWDTHIVLDKMPNGIDYVVKKSVAYKKEERFTNVDSLRQAFNAAIDRLVGIEIKEDTDELINRLKSGECSNEFIDHFAFSLGNILDDPDAVHNALISINSEQFKLFSSLHIELAKKTLDVFKDFSTSQGWTFSYTDVIGAQCKELFYAITDFELRAILTYITVHVGSNHNRWYVMGIARDILESVDNESEALEIANYLEPLSWELKHLNMIKSQVVGKLKDII